MHAQITCVLHGSFRKHWHEIQRARAIFEAAGIVVLAPDAADIVLEKNGFAFLDAEAGLDPRIIELRYLHNLKKLGRTGFSYFVNPEGYIGASVAYELGIAQVSNISCFFQEKPRNHPVYVPNNAIWSPEHLVEYVLTHGAIPALGLIPDEQEVHRLWTGLMVPGSVVAVGAIIVLDSLRKEKEILLVKTHKWGGRYSIVGGKVRRSELLNEALMREVVEETGLQAKVGADICTFDQIKSSGYYLPGVQQIFVDKVVTVGGRSVRLNDEAQDFVWTTPQEALRDLDIEPNARHTVELYVQLSSRAK